jgi:pyruvate dehydrogenase E2 component (dihydrolipoamide acetyltransferase)
VVTTRVFASPLARRLAREQGIDLAAVSGSGPDGRILARDLARPEEPVLRTRVSNTAAARMVEAWAVPAFQLSADADASALRALQRRGEARKLTITDLLVRLTAGALARHPVVNAHFLDGETCLRREINVGLAVDGARGLVVPVLRGVDRSSLAEIADERARVVTQARTGSISARDLEDGTFTISNLGMFRVDRFTAILNPPEVAILAVGRINDVLSLVDGAVVAVPRLELTLTCDHRALDGVTAAAFLQTVVDLIEDPALAL